MRSKARAKGFCGLFLSECHLAGHLNLTKVVSSPGHLHNYASSSGAHGRKNSPRVDIL